MATLHVRNIPDEMYERIRWLAKKRNSTISATVIAAVERQIRDEEWQEYWEGLPKDDLDVPPSELVYEARTLRDAGLE